MFLCNNQLKNSEILQTMVQHEDLDVNFDVIGLLFHDFDVIGSVIP
jgi:hypothetical protein